MAAVPPDHSKDLLFYVETMESDRLKPKYKDSGGSKVLWELRDALRSNGYDVFANSDPCPNPGLLDYARKHNKSAVFAVHPEIRYHSCSSSPSEANDGNNDVGEDDGTDNTVDVVDVRWILAPVEVYGKGNEKRWKRDDLAFHYVLACRGNGRSPIAVSNILQVTNLPYKGDATDLSDAELDSLQNNRSGVAWTMRKGAKMHRPEWLNRHLHEEIPGYDYSGNNVSGANNNRSSVVVTTTEMTPQNLPSPEILRRYEYFVSYDPLTYLSMLAAMSGAISIVHPVENRTKTEWALFNTMLGPYLLDTHQQKQKNTNTTGDAAAAATGNGDHGVFEEDEELAIPGVAYGATATEIARARNTMRQLRGLLVKQRQWGADVTVPRFARDCYRYAVLGERRNFEGAMLVRDLH